MTLLQSSCLSCQAAEVERLERQQALTASTRTSVLTFLAATAEENRVVVRSGMAPVVPHKEMRGPWDGLGVHRQDMNSLEKEQEQLGKLESSQNALLPRKRAASSSVQTVVSQRLKIVGVKSSQGESQTSSRGDSPKTMKNCSSPHQWEGVLGYGSEVSSSRGDSSKTLGNHSSPGQWEGMVGYGSEDSEEL